MATPGPRLTDAEYQRLHRAGHADRWGVSASRFAAAIDASLAHATRDAPENPRDASRRAAALHLEDLALATACIDGHDAAWDHFVQTHRPVLYRASSFRRGAVPAGAANPAHPMAACLPPKRCYRAGPRCR